MGNRAVITTKDKKMGVYLHWNGGRDSVEAFLKYCEMRGFRPPSQDCYGWARLCQVIGNFFGGGLSVGIDRYDRLDYDNGDNGTYVIDGWEIVDRLYHDWPEQSGYSMKEMLRAIDDAQPEKERMGGYLDSVEVNVLDLQEGDEIWIETFDEGWKAFPYLGRCGWDCRRDFVGKPYVKRYENDGRYDANPNNVVFGMTCKIRPRKG